MPGSSHGAPRSTEDTPERSGGIDVEGDITVGGDVAGRDVVKPVTVVGYSAQAVQRLVITVGALVFATAACFFSGGVVLGAGVIARLDDPPVNANGQSVNSSEDAAAILEAKLAAVDRLPAGQAFRLEFSEDELSSWVRFRASEELGLADGKARFLGASGQVVVGGQLRSLGNLSIAVKFSLQPHSDRPLRLESAAVKLIPIAGALGWMAAPNFLFTAFADQLNAQLGRGYSVSDLAPAAAQWTVFGLGE